MIVVIDYKAGNLYNVGNALKYLKADFIFSGLPAEIIYLIPAMTIKASVIIPATDNKYNATSARLSAMLLVLLASGLQKRLK